MEQNIKDILDLDQEGIFYVTLPPEMLTSSALHDVSKEPQDTQQETKEVEKLLKTEGDSENKDSLISPAVSAKTLRYVLKKRPLPISQEIQDAMWKLHALNGSTASLRELFNVLKVNIDNAADTSAIHGQFGISYISTNEFKNLGVITIYLGAYDERFEGLLSIDCDIKFCKPGTKWRLRRFAHAFPLFKTEGSLFMGTIATYLMIFDIFQGGKIKKNIKKLVKELEI